MNINNSSSAPTLRERQIGNENTTFSGPNVSSKIFECFSVASKQMLNLNEPESKINDNVPILKVLIYGKLGQDIISPLMTTKELRDVGVTLFM